jgi:tripartite-type tricarboxylate transporter receptor subunit TctC
MAAFSRIAGIAISAAFIVSSAPFAQADAVADFYRGRTIRLIIGTAVGGSYGIYGQLVSQHLGRHIPGSPSIILQPMPGAGGIVALNYLGNVAPRDGSVITVVHVTIVQEGLFNPGAKFEPGEFQWVGRLASLAFLGVASKKSGIRSLDDTKAREVIAGAPGLANVPAQSPLILNKLAGTRFKVISGYSGIGQVFIAFERGEVEVAATSMDGMRSLYWEQLKRGDMVPIFAQAGRRLKDFPDVPVLLEFSTDDVQKAFLGVFSITADIGRALATPPGVPKDRLDALRTAFDRMIADPSFRADAEKLRLELDPLDGAELHRLVARSMTMSNDTRDKARAFYDDLFKGLR